MRSSMTSSVLSCLFVVCMFYKEIRAEICSTPACKTFAATLNQSIDNTVKPCDDFYGFVCGNFANNTPDQLTIPGRETATISKLVLAELEEKYDKGQPSLFLKAKTFFRACMDTASIEAKGLVDMKTKLKMYGGWPVIEPDWDAAAFNWVETTRRLVEAGDKYDSIAPVFVSYNDYNTSQTLIQFEAYSGLGVGSEDLRAGMDSPLVRVYYNVMVDIAVEFGADREQAQQQLNESLQFEIALARLTHGLYEPQQVLHISEMQEKFNDTDWLQLFRIVLSKYATVNSDDLVYLRSPPIARLLGGFLAKYSSRTIANHMMWQVVMSHRDSLTQRVADLYKPLLQQLYGPYNTTEDRRDYCYRIVRRFDTNVLSPLVAVGYLRTYFKNGSKENSAKLIELFRKQLVKIIDQVDWLDNTTRSRAEEKVLNIKILTGFMDELGDDRLLNKYYEQLTFTETGYLDNKLRVTSFKRSVEFSKLHKPYNPLNWTIQEHDGIIQPDPYYDDATNAIFLFAGYLRGYFFDVERPDFLNVGPLMGIAHELTHSVDNNGAKYDKDGNRINWWNLETLRTFRKKANLVRNEYATYVVRGVNMTLRPDNFLGEIIADQGGYKVARLALQETLAGVTEPPRVAGLEQYSTEQLFWISSTVIFCNNNSLGFLRYLVEHGDHPPAEYRINGPLRNSDQFANDWQCPLGSYMNPQNKFNVF